MKYILLLCALKILPNDQLISIMICVIVKLIILYDCNLFLLVKIIRFFYSPGFMELF